MALHELDAVMLATIDPRLDAAFVRQLDVDASVASRTSFGGTAPERVRAAARELRQRLAGLEQAGVST